MGTVRENGYREYPDDLTPGKHGESNLLFDKHGALAGHAPFHPVDEDESETDEDHDLEMLVKGFALVGLGAAVYGLIRGTVRAVDAIRARKHTAATASESVDRDVQDAPIPVGGTQTTEPDAVDALIEEVESLCREPDSKAEEPRDPRPDTTEGPSEAETRTPPASRRRLLR